jgi:hypothetical protein
MLVGWIMAVLFTSSCADDVTSPENQAEIRDQIVVMTRNVFVGAAIENVFDVESLDQIPVTAAEMWSAVQATDFAERAQAFAGEVAQYNPHLIGLQEVTTFYKQTPSDFDLVGFGPGDYALDHALDFLEIYMDALAARGLDYEVVAVAPHFTAEVPMVDIPDACDAGHPQCLSDMRIQDFDVILARSDVKLAAGSIVESNFPDLLTLVMPPIGLPLPRGWASVDITVAGTDFRFAVTHLEPADQDGIVVPELEMLQRSQAAFLQSELLADGKPVILVGDLNTDAYGQSTATYSDFVAAGWTDAWGDQGGGYTCCETEDLHSWPSILDRRVDLILMYGDFGLGSGGFEGGVEAWIVRDEGSDRTETGLWPSDHAGVVATLSPLSHD